MNTKNISRNNKSNGFSLIEVVFAITIAGLLLTSLFTLQNNMFTNVIKDHFKIARIYFIKNFLFDSDNIEKFKKGVNSKTKLEPIAKKLNEPQMTLKFDLKKINEKSALKKFKNVYIATSTGNWQSIQGQQEEKFINLVYIKPEEKKKE